MDNLPISSIISELCETLSLGRNVVVTAPPGAGKTTQTPLALLQQPWLAGKSIIMLEPRRLAARAAAYRMASLLGESIGVTVGYRIRQDSRIGPETRVEVVTEGILTRLLQQDPSLARYGAILFDEFHERSLHADLGLALSLDAQRLFRPDLRILVMSATLDIAPVTELLNHAPCLSCEGRQYPIQTQYHKEPASFNKSDRTQFDKTVVQTITQSLREETGSILVFLPGRREIRRIENLLKDLSLPSEVSIAPLYGDLSKEDQERAITPVENGQRKIVLATSIAETSLTIEGIRIVIDSGLMRVPRFDPRSGLTRLETIRVTQDSADQRRGRAGRLGPGKCYRLWSESQQQNLVPQRSPEIMDADLSTLVLETAAWGTADLSELSWLTPPPLGAVQQAIKQLRQLHALDDKNCITVHGRAMAEMGLHPRLAHMILSSIPLGLSSLACNLASLLTEGDPLKGPPGWYCADIQRRLDALKIQRGRIEGATIDRNLTQRIDQTARQLQKKTKGISSHSKSESHTFSSPVGLLLAHAYPDRIAKRQLGQERRFQLANGRGAYFPQPDPLAQAEYIVISDLDGSRPWAKIYLAASLEEEDLLKSYSAMIKEQETVWWDDKKQAVQARTQRFLWELILDDRPISNPDSGLVKKALLQGIRQAGTSCFHWTKTCRQWQARVLFARRVDGTQSTLPDLSDAALLTNLETWFEPFVDGVTRLDQLTGVDLQGLLRGLLTWEQQKRLDRLAPTHLTVPSGSRIPLDYQSSEIPILAVRLQEMFGSRETPTVMEGKVPVMLHLLSPAGRPVQVTQDLSGFWKSSYHEVKKELRGRYPKHPWPDDPLQAEPTKRTKKSTRS